MATRARKKAKLPVVAFLSDFGSRDSYVAEVKAQLLAADPAPLVIDITHEVMPHLPAAGAFHLLRSYWHFPPGTIFLAIVDPGVGSARDAVVVEAGDYRFVGPGNGVLRWAVDDAAKAANVKPRVRKLLVEKSASVTFHGRDVFAPAIVQWIKNPRAFLKRPEGQLGGLPFPEPTMRGAEAHGILLHEDHFGNLVTNISAKVPVNGGRVDDRSVVLRPVETYADIPAGAFGLVAGSHGFWEVANRESSAALRLKVKLGHGVVLFVDAVR